MKKDTYKNQDKMMLEHIIARSTYKKVVRNAVITGLVAGIVIYVLARMAEPNRAVFDTDSAVLAVGYAAMFTVISIALGVSRLYVAKRRIKSRN